ncbi:formiminoglutamase [Microcella putealis]|uniref:Formiminoglutamase n=1 Tax=Microcella putealis TaxID=337005 RepID=A0A4Q7LPI7_9MICO|nr:arginase family protein [Microcella putealis]RZS56464.1 formiminoglutamase [Microcella putealis]TQM27050.1 formiminoglutamase [Microcella putealis]
MSAGVLAHDEHWPRAGDWPAWRPGERADAIIVGVPSWRTSLSPSRAHETPAAIRAALRRYSADALMTPSGAPLIVRDAGDLVDPDGDKDAAVAAIAELASHSELVIALGGDNAATVPVALGATGARLASAGLVTVDAHHDLRDGTSNGSPVRRLLEAGLSGERISQLGIEPLANSRFYAERAATHGIEVVTRDELESLPIAVAMERALRRAAGAGGPVVVDLDLDVCDRAVAPACPASIPGGISARELRHAARVAGAHPAVTAIDLTELDASADAADGRTVRLAALCVLEALAGLAARRGGAA